MEKRMVSLKVEMQFNECACCGDGSGMRHYAAGTKCEMLRLKPDDVEWIKRQQERTRVRWVAIKLGGRKRYVVRSELNLEAGS